VRCRKGAGPARCGDSGEALRSSVEIGDRDDGNPNSPPTVKNQTLVLRNGRSAPAASIVADENWPGLFRICWPDIAPSPPANLARCKDAARAWAEREYLEITDKFFVVVVASAFALPEGHQGTSGVKKTLYGENTHGGRSESCLKN